MKKIMALLLGLCIMLGVCACGNSEKSGDSGTGFTAQATELNPTVQGMFYRNVTGFDFLSDDATVKEIDKKSDDALKAIEDYPDSLKAAQGSKTYYISNQGDDASDGLTPETAKANYSTIKGSLLPGDVVLFRRGDLWRGQMTLVNGVSYGAYGEGIKPRFYGSVDGSKNGGGVWEETDTAGVYRFNNVINEYSNIIFNNGEAIGRPVQKLSEITKRELSVVYKAGKVYLYSPNGNPQDIYASIEIAEGYTLLVGSGSANNNIKIQNLCIMYAGVHGIAICGMENLEVEGCIIGYHGGKNLHTGRESLGNGIELWANAKTINIHDNYVFQCFDAGITHQANNYMDYSLEEDDIHYTNNLIEYCLYSIEAFIPINGSGTSFDYPEFFEKYTARMGDVYIENNICRYAGFGWGTLDRQSSVACDLKYRASMHDETLKISGNIFDRPRNGVGVFGTYADKSLFVFTNNTVVQTTKRKIFEMGKDIINVHQDVTTFMGKYFADFSGTSISEIAN